MHTDSSNINTHVSTVSMFRFTKGLSQQAVKLRTEARTYMQLCVSRRGDELVHNPV